MGDGGPCLTGFCPSYNFDLDEITTETSNAIFFRLTGLVSTEIDSKFILRFKI